MMKHQGLSLSHWLSTVAIGAHGLPNLDSDARGWTEQAFEAVVAALRQAPEIDACEIEAFLELAVASATMLDAIRPLLFASDRIVTSLPEGQQRALLAIVSSHDTDWASGVPQLPPAVRQ